MNCAGEERGKCYHLTKYEKQGSSSTERWGKWKWKCLVEVWREGGDIYNRGRRIVWGRKRGVKGYRTMTPQAG